MIVHNKYDNILSQEMENKFRLSKGWGKRTYPEKCMWLNLSEKCLGIDRCMRGQELLQSEAAVAVECCKHILKIK